MSQLWASSTALGTGVQRSTSAKTSAGDMCWAWVKKGYEITRLTKRTDVRPVMHGAELIEMVQYYGHKIQVC